MTRQRRHFYALRRAGPGGRVMHVYRFDTKAARAAWLAEQQQAGCDVEPIESHGALAMKAWRYARAGSAWPVAV